MSNTIQKADECMSKLKDRQKEIESSRINHFSLHPDVKSRPIYNEKSSSDDNNDSDTNSDDSRLINGDEANLNSHINITKLDTERKMEED